VPMLPVLLDVLSRVGPCDVIVLLQPTSPFRQATHIDEAVSLLATTGADTVVSVTQVPHRFLPSSLMQVVGDRLVALDAAAPLLRQHKETLYARNGPAVLACAATSLRTRRDLYGGDLRAYPMDAVSSVDIDTPADLALAEAILAARWA
jgi:CMP-N,N'-diacetyllegionaminic acid synthase